MMVDKMIFGDFYWIPPEDESYTSSVEGVILTSSRMAFEWDEGGIAMGAELTSTDGALYTGTWGDRATRRIGTINGWLYQSAGGQFVFWSKWLNEIRGYEEDYLLFLTTAEECE